ncbi:MAG: hypothetical protein NC241_01260 [Bacteroides sp.]|nr:hypothetical protein [Bacteroides sp.]MCM1457954.1 hypothetical protein [Lachnoclostridium sp.]
MNKFIKLAAMAVMAVAVLPSCSDDKNDTPDVPQSAKEIALSKATSEYVKNTVLPTYKSMADAAIEMADLCTAMKDKHVAGTLTSDDIKAAGDAWKESRKYWELSEAFLFGPAANHNIDPHIDSWPLDKAAMDQLLGQIRNGASWTAENLGYGLLGFHSVEYMLYELSADGNTSLTHSTGYTDEELEYLTGVADDLRDQCVLLEACWAGSDNISARKLEILEDAELGYGEDYGREMTNAGAAGSRFKTFQETAEEIIQGCIDIADEVGNTKIGRPNKGSSLEDRNYIESPYSLNSIEDFAYNIRSIRNSYIGTSASSPSISDYVKSVNPTLDTELRTAIDNAITAINAIPEPFAKNATGAEATKAVEVVNDLVSALEKTYQALGNN